MCHRSGSAGCRCFFSGDGVKLFRPQMSQCLDIILLPVTCSGQSFHISSDATDAEIDPLIGLRIEEGSRVAAEFAVLTADN